MKIHYLEIVTNDIEAACNLHAKIHGMKFGEPEEKLGGARTAEFSEGGFIGIRGPMRDTEEPVVRPYLLVKDISASVEAADKSGAEIAMSPTEVEGRGQFAIIIHGGIESGLWQL